MVNRRRPKGEGSITHLSNGNYKITITIGKGLDGKQKRRSVTGRTKREVLDKAAELRLKYNLMTREEQIISQQTLSYQTFSERIKKTTEDTLAFNTIRNHNFIDTKYIYPFLGHIQIKDITPEICERFLLDSEENEDIKHLSIQTRKHIRNRLSEVLNKAVKRGIITVNPLLKTNIHFSTNIKVKAERFILPETQKIKELLNYLKVKYPEYPFYHFVLLATTTGMRRGELLGLKWNKVDFTRHTITIDNQITDDNQDAPLKTRSSYRTIYLSEGVLKELDTLPRLSAYVISSPQNKTHYSPHTITDLMRKIFKELNFPSGFTFHDFRHFHATQLIQKGINVKVVSRRLGHKDVVTTLNLYFNYMPSMDEEASKMLDNILE